jgi:hypothetical protein
MVPRRVIVSGVTEVSECAGVNDTSVKASRCHFAVSLTPVSQNEVVSMRPFCRAIVETGDQIVKSSKCSFFLVRMNQAKSRHTIQNLLDENMKINCF